VAAAAILENTRHRRGETRLILDRRQGGCRIPAKLRIARVQLNQIIVTTDEWHNGPVDLPPEVGPPIAACWRAPHQGDQITGQLSFRRDGSIFGKPRINYVKLMDSSSNRALTQSALKAIDACLPLQFTPRLAANIAGQVFVIRFVAP
jgi:hypothetical protein